MLRVSNLSISYKKINAVRDISFEIGDGEIVSLIGSNGAGKTSTMRAISGLVRAKSGSITTLEKSIFSGSAGASGAASTGASAAFSSFFGISSGRIVGTNAIC